MHLTRQGILLFLSILLFSLSASAQLINATEHAILEQDSLEKLFDKKKVPGFIFPINYSIRVVKLVHKVEYKGKEEILSGLVFIPQNAKEALPMSSYQHGTILRREDSPSKVELGKGETLIGLLMSADGYVVAMPDYFGLGDNVGLHPYMHSETEALATVSFLEVAKAYVLTEGVTLNEQLFLLGYSQGGHATMVTQKVLQEEYADVFPVTASAPMSGPYDVSGIQSETILDGLEYSRPGYMPYMMLAYNEQYGFTDDMSSVFIAPYDTLLPQLFDQTKRVNEINTYLPSIPAKMLRPELISSFGSDSTHAFLKALRLNDAYNWTPQAPTRLCYCKGDEQVDYRNSILAYKTMKANGAPHVSKKMAGKRFRHVKCALFSLAFTKFWLDSFRKGSETGKKGPFFKRMALNTGKIFMSREGL